MARAQVTVDIHSGLAARQGTDDVPGEVEEEYTYGPLYREMQPSCAKPFGRSDALSRCSWTYPCRTSRPCTWTPSVCLHTFPPHSTDHLSLKTAPCRTRLCCYTRSPQPQPRRHAVTYGCKQGVTGRCCECQVCAHPDNTIHHPSSRRESLSGSCQSAHVAWTNDFLTWMPRRAPGSRRWLFRKTVAFFPKKDPIFSTARTEFSVASLRC
ncbi:hypothetical protein C8Q80DRAFT_868393 [Daedaleopsis nitida]|nr:hypothetical protein C8Q80DRAFT_868393 [Daedaleopsis nitida]